MTKEEKTKQTELYRSKIIEIVNRWNPIAPLAAIEQARHELHVYAKHDAEYELKCAMWAELDMGNLEFTTERELRPR